MKRIKIFLLVSLVILTTGCWDSKEVGSLAIVTGLGIDVGPTDDEIRLVIQVGDMAKSDKGGGETEPIILDSSGVNIQSGIEKLKIQSTRSLYFSHNQAILIGEEQARKGIACFLDWFIRNENTRMEIPLIVAKDDAKTVLETNTTQDHISAFAIKNMLDNEISSSFYSKINLLSFLAKHMDKTTCPISPIISSKMDSDQNKILEISGTAIFNEGKMVGELDIYQTEGLMWVLGQSPKRNIIVKNEDGNAALAIINTHSEMSTELKDNKVENKVKVKAMFRISEIAGFKDFDFKDIIPIIEEITKDEIYSKIESAIKASMNYQSDIFGFGANLHKKCPEDFKKVEADWNNIYKDSNYTIDINIHIQDSGKTNGIITDKKK